MKIVGMLKKEKAIDIEYYAGLCPPVIELL